MQTCSYTTHAEINIKTKYLKKIGKSSFTNSQQICTECKLNYSISLFLVYTHITTNKQQLTMEKTSGRKQENGMKTMENYFLHCPVFLSQILDPL